MSALLNVICSTCRKPIADGEGYLYVNHADVRRHQAARLDFDRARAQQGPEVDLDALLALPPEARWEATHIGNCDPDNQRADYSISVDQVRTWQDLIRRTTHLMGKSWFDSTDWDQVLDDAAAGRGTRVTPRLTEQQQPKVSDEDISLVRRLNPVTDVIRATVNLAADQAPQQLRGDCPLCQSASKLRVAESAAFWRCDYCGLGGDVIAWVRCLHGLSYREAVQALAVRAGVRLNREAGA